MKYSYFLLLLCMVSGLLQAQNKELWATTEEGGEYGAGAIYRLTGAGTNQTVAHSFEIENEGYDARATSLCETSDGKFYGMTRKGGSKDSGVIYSYDPQTSIYTKIHDFGTLGYYPEGGLIVGSNGKLYGTTMNGGSYNSGILFEYDLSTQTMTRLYSLGGSQSLGRTIHSQLLEASNGKLYGIGQTGGIHNKGVLWEFDISTTTYTKKIDFDGTTTGSAPRSGVIELTGGRLYGMTYEGGANDKGVIYEYNYITDVYTKVLDFSGTANGQNPTSVLTQISNGKLYGLTPSGGANNGGVIFEVDPATNTYAKKIDLLNSDTGSHGINPQGGFGENFNGQLYVVFNSGGDNNQGLVANYDPFTNTIKKFHHLSDDSGNGQYGMTPIVSAYTGKLYCATSKGGSSDSGTIFEQDRGVPSHINGFFKKIDFNIIPNGGAPVSGIVLADNNKYYGTTKEGGNNGLGVLYEYDRATDMYAVLVHFDGTNGETPTGQLVYAANGHLYGLTNTGGSNDDGVLFQYKIAADSYAVLVDFSEATTGSAPMGTLLEASNGKLYGIADRGTGGVFGTSLIFEYDLTTSSYQIVKQLTSSDGYSHISGLMEATNGSFYSMTRRGGLDDLGVFYEYNSTSSVYTSHMEFDGTSTGSYPEGKLMQAENGKIYGSTSQGGTSNGGTLFEFDITTNTHTKLIDVTGSNITTYPSGSLFESKSGTLIGISGTLLPNAFRYEIAAGSITKTHQFVQADGRRALNTEFVAVCNTTPVVANIESCGDYTSPSGMLLTMDGIYNDMVVGSYGCDSLITINLTIIENTWSDGAWCLGSAPTSISDGIIDEDYTFSTDGVFSARDLTVESGATLIVDNNQTLAVDGDLINNGSIIVESGSSLITYANFSFTGNDVIIKRNTRYADGKYSMVGTPVKSNPSVTDVTLGSNVYYYDEEQPFNTNDGLDRWIYQTGNLIPAVGYTQAFQQEIIFTGVPNSGPITYAGTYTEDTDDANEGWQFVSNPYPAAIYVDEFLSTNPNNTGAVYIWDDNGSDTGRGTNSDYIVANESMATTTSAGGQSRYNFHLGSAQGFFIKLNDDTDTDIDFVEDMRVLNNNADGNFFRETELPIIRLNLTNSEGLFKQAVVGFAEDAAVDQINRKYDAPAFNASSDDGLFTLKAGRTLALNGITLDWESIQLQLNVKEAGTYQFSVDLEGYDSPLYLRDNLTEEIVDLRNGAYSFSTQAGIDTDRFELLSSLSDVLGLEQNEVLVYAIEHTLHISQKDNQKREYQLFSMNGKQLLTTIAEGKVEVDLSKLPSGVFLVFDGQKTHKIILN